MFERVSRQEVMMEVAKQVSRRATCNRAQVGCVVEREGRIVVVGYNGAPPKEPHCLEEGCIMVDGHCVRTLHAEANAVAFAAKHGIALNGCTIYMSGWPLCDRCRKLTKAAGIVRAITDEGIEELA